jgi:hypothetical protein
MKKKKVHKLVFDEVSDFYLLAIASHENDYRLTWALNQNLNLKLIKGDDFTCNHPKHKVEAKYSMYNFEDENNHLKYNLISNKSENGFLLPDLKNIDFVLRVSGDMDQDNLNTIVQKLKKIDIVITAFVIEEIPDRYKKMFIF